MSQLVARFLWSLLPNLLPIWAVKDILLPEDTVELARSGPNEDPLKRWLGSLKFRLESNVTHADIMGGVMAFELHDLMCHSMTLSSIGSSKYPQGVGLAVQTSGLGIVCEGKWKTTGTVSKLVVGDGAITAKTDESKNNKATVGFNLWGASRHAALSELKMGFCEADLNFNIDLQVAGMVTSMVVKILLATFGGLLNELIKYQIQSKVCGALRDTVTPQLEQLVQKLNKLLLPPQLQRRLEESGNGSQPELPDDGGDVDDRPAGPGVVDWTQTPLLEWASWISTKVLPPSAIHELSRWALQGEQDMHLDLRGLPNMEHGFVVDQAASGLRLGVTATLQDITLEGAQSLKAYSMKAVSPTELQFSCDFGTEEQPKAGVAATLLVRFEAKDTAEWWRHDAVSSVEEKIGFHVALLRPRARVQVRLPCKSDLGHPHYTASQWFWDPINCSRSLFVEAPTVERQNLTFEGLSEPLSWTALTPGILEEDLSTLFNELVALFNQLYEAHLPQALTRIAGSEEGLKALNGVLAHLASPTECIALSEANHKTKGIYGEEFSDWPKLLTGQIKQYMDHIIAGLFAANTTVAPPFLLEMPAVSAGPFTKLHLKDLLLRGTNQITDARAMVPNPQTSETLGFYLTNGCPSDERPYHATLVMTVAAEKPKGEALIEVDAPCGVFEMVLNVSIDTLEVANMLVPPTLFCSLMTPFNTLKVQHLKPDFDSLGEIRVTLGSKPARKPLQELWALYPQLGQAVHGMLESLMTAKNLTDVLEFLHQEAVRDCDAGASRRLTAEQSEAKGKDAQGISYDKGFNAAVWMASLLGGLAAAAAAVGAVVAQAGRQKATGSKPLAVHCWLAGRGESRWFVIVICLMLAFSVILRIVACSMPYMSLKMRMVYTPDRLELDSQTVATFTYWGLALQFKDAGGSLVFIKFVITSLVSGLAACVILALPWLQGLSFSTQHVLIRVAIWVGRLPFQESQTLANAGLSVNANLALPLDAESQMRTAPLAGPFIAVAACLLSLGAGVAMIASLPQRSARVDRPDAKQLALPDLALCSGILTGTFIWLFFAFVSIGFRGLASLVLTAGSYSGLDLGAYSPGLKLLLLVQTVFAPVGQAVLAALRAIELVSERWRLLEEICMSLNALDVFAIVFLSAFISNVDGFTTSFVDANFADEAANVQKLFGMEVIRVDAGVAEMGTVGLCIAAVCTLLLYIRSSMQFHAIVPKTAARRDLEDSTVAVELQ